MGGRMTLNQLRYVVAVARERHFGRAADTCFVSQPTLSVAVKKLEEELGVSLFERGAGEIGITDIGSQIIAQAQRVLEEAEAVGRLARSGRDPLVGPLRLGAIYTIGPYVLPQLIPLVTQRARQMPLLIEENFTSVLTERLKRSEVDLILISLPFDEPGLVTLPLYDEEFVVLVPGSHPWARCDKVDAAGLADERVLLLGAGHCFRDQVLAAFPQCLPRGPAEGSLQRGLEGGSLETIRYMVAGGVGVTVLPCTAARQDRFAEGLVCARPFAGAVPRRRVALAWRKSFTRTGAIDVVADAVRAAHLSCVQAVEPVSAADADAGP